MATHNFQGTMAAFYSVFWLVTAAAFGDRVSCSAQLS